MLTKTLNFGPGSLTIAADKGALLFCKWGRQAPAFSSEGSEDDASVLEEAARQLQEYFAGTRRSFELPLCPSGTEFRRAVWRVAATVPYGSTASYGEIARAIGRPGASRAVGTALHVNPLHIIIPCHRIVPASGEIGAYAAGTPIKRALLELEALDKR